jgi:hypothetical protein
VTGADIMRLRCSPGRRVAAVGLLGILGAFLVWSGLASPSATPLAVVVLVGAGIVALVLGWQLWQATAGSIVLTATEIVDDRGRVLCRIADVERIETGMLALKPANGFLVHLRAPAPRAWAPGLWWRHGRRLGIGGSVSRHEAKAMAEIVQGLIAQRPEAGE